MQRRGSGCRVNGSAVNVPGHKRFGLESTGVSITLIPSQSTNHQPLLVFVLTLFFESIRFASLGTGRCVDDGEIVRPGSTRVVSLWFVAVLWHRWTAANRGRPSQSSSPRHRAAEPQWLQATVGGAAFRPVDVPDRRVLWPNSPDEQSYGFFPCFILL